MQHSTSPRLHTGVLPNNQLDTHVQAATDMLHRIQLDIRARLHTACYPARQLDPHVSCAEELSPRTMAQQSPTPLSGQTTFPQERTEESWFHQQHGLTSDTGKWARAMSPQLLLELGGELLLKSVRLPYLSGLRSLA